MSGCCFKGNSIVSFHCGSKQLSMYFVCSVLPVYQIMHAQITLKDTRTYVLYCTYTVEYSTQCVEKSPMALRGLVCTVYVCEYVLARG